MSDFGLDTARDLRSEMAGLSRSVASALADPQSLSADRRPVSMGRRMARVTAVDLGPPLRADVELDGVPIEGASPQSTYRPIVDDIVWLEMQGTDPHISPPLATEANQGWTNLLLINSWVQYTAGGWVVPVSCHRNVMGEVRLRGSCGGGATESIIAVLPVGFRPPLNYSGHPVSCHDGTGPAYGVVAIAADGSILYQGPTTPVQVALDGITFRLD